MIEKRFHKRIAITSTAILKFKDQKNKPSIETIVSNISLSGIGLYTENHVEKDLSVSLEITFVSMDGNKYTETIEGHIVNIYLMRFIYYMGIEFDEGINPTKQPRLYEYLKELLNY